MRIAAGILCHNQEANGRAELFDECLASVREAGPDALLVLDNGSTDGTADRVAALPEGLAHRGPISTCGYGMNVLGRTLVTADVDVIVMSNDDIVWQPDSFDRLRKLWDAAPEGLAIVSGLVEPTFALPDRRPWNEVLGVTVIAGEKLWVRRSVPGGAWTFRRTMADRIFPVPTFAGIDDVPTCERLAEQQLVVCAADMAVHAGVGMSTWGNGSERFTVEPLEDVLAREPE